MSRARTGIRCHRRQVLVSYSGEAAIWVPIFVRYRPWPCLSLQDLLQRGLGRFFQSPAKSDICVCCGWCSSSVESGLCLDCKATMEEMGPEAFAKYIEFLSAEG